LRTEATFGKMVERSSPIGADGHERMREYVCFGESNQMRSNPAEIV